MAALRLVKGARPTAPGEPGRASRRAQGGGDGGAEGAHPGGEAALLPLVASVLALGLLLALVVWRYGPPPPHRPDAPPAAFSAARAHRVLARILGGGAPHPTGSAANEAVRGRLLDELRRLGLEPFVDSRLACRGGRCATVHNVMARIPGEQAGLPSVLLATHYDSVAAGPGASDDAAGVAAALEVARAVLAGPRLRRDLLLLVDDGEEQALLGAQAYVEHALKRHAWAREVGAVVNLEARGTSGASLLFELSRGNARLVGAAARSLPRPATSSIFYAIYQRLPNDTDLTVFKEAGLPGVNFAFVGAPLRYHTPRDDLRHADLGTLQHHGDNALALVRALAGEEGSWQAEGDAVFFDVLTLFVLRWPAALTAPLALLALALVLWGARRLLRGEAAAGGGRPVRAVAWGVAAVVLLLALAGGLAWALLALLRALDALPYLWIAEARPLEGAFWGAAVLAAGLAAGLLGRRLGPAGAWSATWGLWALLAVAVSLLDPSLAYPFVAAALVAGGLAAAWGGPPPRTPWLALAPLAVAATLLFPFAWFLYTGMGTPALLGVALLVALVLTALLPALAAAGGHARWALAVAALSLLVVSGSLVLLRPPFTRGAPQPMALVELHLVGEPDDAGGEGGTRRRWVVPASYGPLPESWHDWSFGRRPEHPYPWLPDHAAWVAEAPGPSPPAPELVVKSYARDGRGVVVQARLRSPRGAPWAGLLAPAERWEGARVGGVDALSLDREGSRDEGWVGVEHVTLPREGAAVELRFRGAEPVELWLWDGRPGVSASGAALTAARPEHAVPIHRGDRMLVARRIVLAPPAVAATPPTAAPAPH